MALEQMSLSRTVQDESIPACAAQCTWYETNSTSASCLNRQSFVCHKHRADVFGDTRAELRQFHSRLREP